MKDEKIIYSLSEEDIQNVSLEVLDRELSSDEIQKIIPVIEKKINWHDVITTSINENIET